MNRKIKVYLIILLPVTLAAVSCSTTRVLQDGEYRLAKNKLEVTNDRKFNPGQIEPYLKQRPNSYFIFGWNPFLNVYNWSNGKGKGWDRFVQKIGVAPVVYDPDMVESSIDNITSHLDYLGYYNSKVTSSIKVKKKRVYVNYAIELGDRYHISSIDYHLPEGELADDFLADTSKTTIKPGDYLSEADTMAVPGKAALDLTINEYTRNASPKDAVPFRKFIINDVEIKYPKSLKIRNNVLRNLNTIIPGNIYSETDVNNTYSRLSALRMFRLTPTRSTAQSI